MEAPKRLLLTPLLLLPLTACSDESQAAAKDALGQATEAAGQAAQSLVEKIRSIDTSAVSPAALREHASEALNWITSQLEGIQDSKTAERVAATVGPVLDSASGLIRKAAAELPERSAIKERVDGLRERYEDDPGVLKHLEPVLAKLSELLG